MKKYYFDSLIDDFGIWQHSDGERALRSDGYALDDAARGLLLCLATHRLEGATVLFKYVQLSASDAHFFGFATAERNFFGLPASEDAEGQAIWAMGYALSKHFMVPEAKKILRESLEKIEDITYVRGLAYSLLGALYIDHKLAVRIATKLIGYFDDTSSDWLWPEPNLTYANGIVPYALLRSGLDLGNHKAIDLGLRVLRFVNDRCTLNRMLGPIGNEGWLSRGQILPPDYSQQPIDTGYMVWAWLAAYQLQHDQLALRMAKTWYSWFEGNNISKLPMYEAGNLKCFDGIDKDGLNIHSGAEANICLLLTKWLLQHRTTI